MKRMKHKEIVLVLLGYLIGFVTAFILFALGDSGSKPADTEFNETDSYGLVAKASQSGSQQAAIVEAFVTNEGLFAKIGDVERIVSAGTIPPEEGAPGYHYAVPYLAVSPNQQYLHYCVQTEPNDARCDHYIYKVTSDTIYLVKDVPLGEYLESEVASLSVSWMSDNRLSIDGRMSRSAEEPWFIE